MSEHEQAAPKPPPDATGVSYGHDGSFADAARDAEDDLKKRRGGLPDPPETFEATLYVKIGNPIHEYIVELRPRP
jgi:hypothetical protein